MTTDDLTVFSCTDCVVGRQRGHGPVWMNDQGQSGLLCLEMQRHGLCGKALLAQLVEDQQITIQVVVEG